MLEPADERRTKSRRETIDTYSTGAGAGGPMFDPKRAILDTVSISAWIVVAIALIFGILATPASAYNLQNCQFDSAQPPSITYREHSLETHNESAVATAQSNWDDHTDPTTYFYPVSSGDPNIDIYDGHYTDTWSAIVTYNCWYAPTPNSYVGDEVMMRLNENHMPSTTRGRWVTTAHEFGHAYGLDHDDMTCAGDPKVMEQGTEKYGCSGNPPWDDDVDGWSQMY